MLENVNPKDLEEGRKYLMSGSVGGGLPIIVDSGKGAIIQDTNGKEYIDCTSQAWTYNVGVSHPKVLEAVQEQVKKITHVRTSFETIPKLLLLKKLGDKLLPAWICCKRIGYEARNYQQSRRHDFPGAF